MKRPDSEEVADRHGLELSGALIRINKFMIRVLLTIAATQKMYIYKFDYSE